MRKAKSARQHKPKVPRLTQAEKLHKRRFKRKHGPSAQRRKKAREYLQPKTVTPTEE